MARSTSASRRFASLCRTATGSGPSPCPSSTTGCAIGWPPTGPASLTTNRIGSTSTRWAIVPTASRTIGVPTCGSTAFPATTSRTPCTPQ